MVSVKAEALPELFESVAAVMSERADELCDMDAKMGDGDLGLTMRKGFAAMPEILRELDEPDIGKRLMKAGMKMASVVPSTMGTLMSSGIMAGGKAICGCSELDANAYLAYIQGFADGIAKRGRCARGERTVLDAIGGAADRLAAAMKRDPALSLQEAGEAAVVGAK